MEYRHELKFLVTDVQMNIIAFKLAPFLKKDCNQNGDHYVIRSLYFDNVNHQYWLENLNGVDNRSKYRIRIYNNSTELIKLEKKSKISGMTQKQSVTLSLEESKQLIEGRIPIRNCTNDEKKIRLYSEMKVNGLIPVVIVEYERSAYVNRVGNVRITFDRNIKSSPDISRFWGEDAKTIPVLPTGYHVLEIKYDEFLPRYIYDLLDDGTLQQTSFSKYGYARSVLEER